MNLNIIYLLQNKHYIYIHLYTTELSMIIDRSGKKVKKIYMQGWQIDFDGLEGEKTFMEIGVF